jgi:hypothetical protein
MAKKKEKKVVLRDCAKCISSKTQNDVIYCKLRLQDENVLKDSGVVTKQDCVYFKEKVD